MRPRITKSKCPECLNYVDVIVGGRVQRPFFAGHRTSGITTPAASGLCPMSYKPVEDADAV